MQTNFGFLGRQALAFPIPVAHDVVMYHVFLLTFVLTLAGYAQVGLSLLIQLDVADVVVLGKLRSEGPVIHILDWHYVPEALIAIDVQHKAGVKLSRDEVAKLYEQHLRDVDQVQLEQMAVLRDIAKEHRQLTVLVEGVTDTSILLFEARVQAFLELKKEIAAKPKLPRAAQLMLLELGAAGRLLIEGMELRVLPLEDEKLLAAAKPVNDGKIVFDQEKNKEREAEMVRRIQAEPGLVVVICGGSHDFARRLGERKYERIATKTYRLKSRP